MGRESREKAAEKEFCRPSFSPNKKHWKAAGNTLPEKRNICLFLFELQSPGFHTGMESFTNSERNKRKGTSDSEKKKKTHEDAVFGHDDGPECQERTTKGGCL